jgi:hypothetical protein
MMKFWKKNINKKTCKRKKKQQKNGDKIWKIVFFLNDQKQNKYQLKE